MRQTLESPSQLIHTTSRWSIGTPLIKVSYPFSPALEEYIKEIARVTVANLNQPAPTFKLSDEYPKCKIYEYRVKMPDIVVKYHYSEKPRS